MDSPVLNIAISLVFLYTLYSLLVTIISEIMATLFSARGKVLAKAIERMLEDEAKNIWHYYFVDRLGRFWQQTRKWIYNLIPIGKQPPVSRTFTDDFFNNPAIKYLGEGKLYRRPSYISAENFSKTIIELLREKGVRIRWNAALKNGAVLAQEDQDALLALCKSPAAAALMNTLKVTDVDIKAALANTAQMSGAVREVLSGVLHDHTTTLPHSKDPVADIREALSGGSSKIFPETRKQLLSLLNEADYDLEKFRVALEKWFDEMMDRVTGWYKRKSKLKTFIIGLVVAVTFNVDTIEIVTHLDDNSAAATQLADLAATYVETNKDNPYFQKPAVDTTGVTDSVALAQAAADAKKPVTDSALKANDSIVKALLAKAQTLIDTDISQTDSILGLGWKFDSTVDVGCTDTTIWFAGIRNTTCKICNRAAFIRKHTTGRDWLGFLLTALAISLGAPFWFDLLNKLVRLRGSGTDTDKKRKATPAPKPGTNPAAPGNTTGNGGNTGAG